MSVDDSPPHPRWLDQFLVCGLGSLGQHCVTILKTFGVIVHAIEAKTPIDWELTECPQLLSQLHIGDCRQNSVLLEAQIQHCRAILIVTSDERTNLETAFAARLLNPHLRLVVRSAKQNFNQLLAQQLGNYIAFEPTQLSAPAFALAALSPGHQPSTTPTELLGFFQVEADSFQVMKHHLISDSRWLQRSHAHELNSRLRRVLSHQPSNPSSLAHELAQVAPFQGFHQWESDAPLQVGDHLITLERTPHLPELTRQVHDASQPTSNQPWQRLQDAAARLRQFWRALRPGSGPDQIRRVVLTCILTVVILWLMGTIFFDLFYPEVSWIDAFYATAVLLLGGYGDLFDGFELDYPIPGWLRLFGLGLTIVGTAFIAVLYALLTEKLLTWRLQFLPQRPPVPQSDHVLVIGLDPVGQSVVKLLQKLRQPLVMLTDDASAGQLLPRLPLLASTTPESLTLANLATAKSVVAVTADEIENLELGLNAHRTNPNCGLVIRTYDQRFTEKIRRLFPYAQSLCTSALSAEAFVAAAFGENVLSLFRIDQQTILITDYRIEAGDTLNGLLLAEVAYGYGVVPLMHQRSTKIDLPESSSTPISFMPSDDLRLHIGDRLVVLATIAGLQHIERGEQAPRAWQVEIQAAQTSEAIFEGANEIARISGCPLNVARNVMAQLPGTFSMLLYKPQAQRLVRRLRRVQVAARCLPAETRPSPSLDGFEQMQPEI
ncbi:potassium transporter TrkA [Synechococcales cyanobacterium C]|uniref:Potassium transporter TrkA n=1 Tax=Petrachloros mirabilis ULC683 TaxID=2781853 RepID=A0A8K2A0A7_9CYAN|nr:NAD-binding protein [Petrachloros mirabilis]NCJ08118.1 potassium transporter TrkA [Petrachloros mirabilis ULC683]